MSLFACVVADRAQRAEERQASYGPLVSALLQLGVTKCCQLG